MCKQNVPRKSLLRKIIGLYIIGDQPSFLMEDLSRAVILDIHNYIHSLALKHETPVTVQKPKIHQSSNIMSGV